MRLGKIVIVDDEKIVTSAFKTLFKVEGYEDVHLYNSPAEALEFLRHETPDLIISDFLMPEMNGLEFLREAKKLHNDVSMILLTGYADKENAIKAINDIGLYKYIEKPWDNDDLLMNIRNGIERSHLVSNLEKLVRERTAELSGIFNYCADGIIIIDNKSRIERVNPACENMTGLSAGALVNKSFYDITRCSAEFLPDADMPEFLLRDCCVINELSKKDTPVEVHFAAISDEKYVGVIRDVSVQKETEKLRDDFIATLTHDLRTPLLAAIQTLRFFLEGSIGSLEEKQKVLLSTMLHSNEDLLGLVNALLEVYRFESGQLKLCKTNFPLKDLVVQCYEELKPLTQKKNQDFEFVFEIEDNVYIQADRAELKRVITNLCGNAVNYTNPGGKITVLTKIRNNDLIFSVTDNGNGIPKEDMGNLFTRFSQGTTKKRSTGTGLGLYLSRQIIEAHGGKIWAESKIDKGSEFSFLLTDVAVSPSPLAGAEVNSAGRIC
ncbi:MAG: response regulator [Heliobacteriaceae bacterium]|jgi:PAS domain S-box-containing protein|nr:response regulator [Heliobacteriaceae bacterium]